MDFELFMEKYGYKILLGIMFGVAFLVAGAVLIVPALPDLLKGRFSEAAQILLFIIFLGISIGGIVYKTRPTVSGVFGRYWYRWKR
ncbi:hypothetical protein [Thermococcus alcaliphilus]|uniref:hypothetical protein n=1 Tax=Thermococcus alcaliphilus TaxID=139207 RepID=UPI0020902782|nr:hypothetical protein [Thermococcus alcaliphilus]MCO6040511.1 hypothetical protein [Thermococcus alcaliphilus]